MNIIDTLAAMIDQHGITATVEALQAACDTKAGQADTKLGMLRQAGTADPFDLEQARKWNRIANSVYTLLGKVRAEEL